ncbi:hypothetical protein CGMCC3_g9785 [Colletotrichum fructicola]|nr:uncharacterized protein CGMCC3_g9785 [Colletotrichum fructicola]KAE9573963.1 hypothetical protein CGMCC3_g9785 [Colletotrichum fructicola]
MWIASYQIVAGNGLTEFGSGSDFCIVPNLSLFKKTASMTRLILEHCHATGFVILGTDENEYAKKCHAVRECGSMRSIREIFTSHETDFRLKKLDNDP